MSGSIGSTGRSRWETAYSSRWHQSSLPMYNWLSTAAIIQLRPVQHAAAWKCTHSPPRRMTARQLLYQDPWVQVEERRQQPQPMPARGIVVEARKHVTLLCKRYARARKHVTCASLCDLTAGPCRVRAVMQMHRMIAAAGLAPSSCAMHGVHIICL